MRRILSSMFLLTLASACGDGWVGSPDAEPGGDRGGPAPGAVGPGQMGSPGAASPLGADSSPTAPDGPTGGGVGADQPAADPGSSPNASPGGDAPGGMNTPGNQSPSVGDTPNPGTEEPTLADCDTPGPRLIRRLTAAQYDNTVDWLVGDQSPDEVVFSDPIVLGFGVDADAPLVSDLTAELLMNYAERVSAWVIENQPWKVAACTTHDESCHRRVIEEFGRKAFRQEPTSEQVNTYLQMFAAEQSFEAGLHVVLSTMLQSPYLLYRRELGEPDPEHPGQYRLTPYEIAAELSYFLADSPPDEQLLDAAAQDRLQSPQDIDQHVYRLMSQEKGKAALARFVHGWLEVDDLFKKAKDPEVFELTDSLRQAMLDQTQQFFLELFQSGGTIGDLYGADFTFVNQPLAELYGLSGVGGDTFSRVSLTGTQRATGVLGHAAFLTQHSLPENSSPVQRGVVVRERLLCHELPPVPENLDTNLDESAGFSSNRERYEQHSSDPNCAGCHAVIDPIGFAFEHYDAFGRYRDQDMGSPVDAQGELTGVEGGPIALDGLQSLSDYLATSEEARSCLIRYWSYFAHGRDEWEQKECNHDAIRTEAREGNYTLQNTLFAIVHAPHFTRRVAD